VTKTTRAAACASRHVQTAQARHLDVEEQHVWRMLLERGASLPSAARDDLEPGQTLTARSAALPEIASSSAMTALAASRGTSNTTVSAARARNRH
jgi:hypothetical protein